MKKQNKNAGFTLVELIVAVVLLGIIIVPLLHTLLTGTHTARKSAEAQSATQAAQSVIELIKAKGAGEVYDDPSVLGAWAEAENSTDETKNIKISAFTSGTREYDGTISISTALDDNDVELAKSNAMDPMVNTANMKYADAAAVEDFRERYKTAVYETQEDGTQVFVGWSYPDTAGLTRSIEIDALRTESGSAYDYTVTVSFIYTETSRNYDQTIVSRLNIKDVAKPMEGDAAFSVYVIYDAFYCYSPGNSYIRGKDADFGGSDIEIKNSYTDADYNVFLINSSESQESLGSSITYNYQLDDELPRVFSNFSVGSYKAYKSGAIVGHDLTARINAAALTETAAVRRRYLVRVSLNDGSDEIASFSEEMLS